MVGGDGWNGEIEEARRRMEEEEVESTTTGADRMEEEEDCGVIWRGMSAAHIDSDMKQTEEEEQREEGRERDGARDIEGEEEDSRGMGDDMMV